MKILILDLIKESTHRISKDTSGGYGTGNNFGTSLIPKILKKLIKKYSDFPPIYCAYIFSVLEKNGHTVFYSKTLPDKIYDYDLYILSSSIVCSETECEVIKKLKTYKKNVIAVGPFATNMPKPYQDAGASVLMGEPEFYFLKNKNFENDLNKPTINFEHNFTLDDLPFPAWDKIISNFKNVNRLFGNYKSVTILATRGCPYSCARYCVYPLQQGKLVRQRSIKNIVDEMEYWKNTHGIRMFIFRDPVFSINKKHTTKLCQELIDRKTNIYFMIETHLRILDSDLINILKKAGLKAVKVGVENASEELLKHESRSTITKDNQLKKIREIEKNKIQISAMYILGYPSDNNLSIQATIDYAKYLNTTYAQFSIFTPYPGTPAFEEFKNNLDVKKYEDFDQYQLVYKHKEFSKVTISKYLDKAYSSYYSRLSWLFKYFYSFI